MIDKLIEIPLRLWCTGVVVAEITTLTMMGMLSPDDLKDISATYGLDMFGVDVNKAARQAAAGLELVDPETGDRIAQPERVTRPEQVRDEAERVFNPEQTDQFAAYVRDSAAGAL